VKPPPIPWTTFFAIVCGLAGAACLVLAEPATAVPAGAQLTGADFATLRSLADRALTMKRDLSAAYSSEAKASGINSDSAQCLDTLLLSSLSLSDALNELQHLGFLDRAIRDQQDELVARVMLRVQIRDAQAKLSTSGRGIRNVQRVGSCASEPAASSRAQSLLDLVERASDQLASVSDRLSR